MIGTLISVDAKSIKNDVDPFIKGADKAVNEFYEVISIVVNKRGSVVSVDYKHDISLDVKKRVNHIVVRTEAGKEISMISLQAGKLDKGILIKLDKNGKVESSSEKHVNAPNKSHLLLKELNDKELTREMRQKGDIKVIDGHGKLFFFKSDKVDKKF